MAMQETDRRRPNWRTLIFFLSLTIAFALPLVVWAGAWDSPERVDAPPLYWEMGPRSLAIDSAGRPRVAFGGDHLYYAWYDGAVWHTVVVDDSPGVGRYTSLALEADDTPHISYYDAADGDLRYVTGVPQPDGSCVFGESQAVDSAGNVGMYSAIALDGSLPRIAYYDATLTALKHVTQRSDGTWEEPVVIDGYEEGAEGDDREVGEYVSLAIDTAGASHVSYRGEVAEYIEGRLLVTDTLAYATNVGGGWQAEPIIADVSSQDSTELWLGYHTCIAVTGGGSSALPYISFRRRFPNEAFFAYKDVSNAWHQEKVADTLDAGAFTSLVVVDQTAYMSWYEAYRADLWLASKSLTDELGTWDAAIIDDRGDVGRYCSLAAAADGTLHITYYDADQRRLRHMVDHGAGWESETIGQQPAHGQVLAADVDLAGNAKLVVHDPASGALTYIQQEGDEWYSERVAASGVTEGHADLVATSEGALIVYYDENTTSLRLAERTASGWDIQTVDTDGDVGRYCSLAVDNRYDATEFRWCRHIHIAYYDADQERLLYRYRNDCEYERGEWNASNRVVDDQDRVGRYASIVVDTHGDPHISYYCEAFGDLRLASFTVEEGWTTVTLDADFDRGRYSRIALAPDGWPCIVYYHDDTLVVDQTPTPGPSPTPTVGPSPTPTPLQSRLRYAHVVADTWYTDTLCNPDDALDPYDHHQIVTQVAAIHDLVIAENAYGELAPHVLYRETSAGPRVLAHLVDSAAPVPEWDFDTKDDAPGLGSGAALAEEWGETLFSVYSLDATLRISRTYRGESIPPVEMVRDMPISLALADPATSIPVTSTTWFTAAARMDEYASVAIQSNGQPCVAYQDVTRRDLRYAWRDDVGIWHREIVDRDGDTGNYISLAFDPTSGQPRIAYVGSNDLRYAQRSHTSGHPQWHWEIVAEGATYVSLALDALGMPRIAYHSTSNEDLDGDGDPDPGLRFIWHDGTTWAADAEAPLAGNDTTTGLYASLALDSAGRAHVASYAEPARQLGYCRRDGANQWQCQVVATEAAFAGEYCDIALDAADRPHISARGNGALLYATTDGLTWTVRSEWGDDDPDAASDTAIAIADDGSIHIIYRDEANGRLRHVERLPGEGWGEPQTVDARGDVGRHASLVACDGEEGLWAAYANASSGDILASHYDPARPTSTPTVTPTPTVYLTPTPGPTATAVAMLSLPLVLRDN